jgi:hypothetical protein
VVEREQQEHCLLAGAGEVRLEEELPDGSARVRTKRTTEPQRLTPPVGPRSLPMPAESAGMSGCWAGPSGPVCDDWQGKGESRGNEAGGVRSFCVGMRGDEARLSRAIWTTLCRRICW